MSCSKEVIKSCYIDLYFWSVWRSSLLKESRTTAGVFHLYLLVGKIYLTNSSLSPSSLILLLGLTNWSCSVVPVSFSSVTAVSFSSLFMYYICFHLLVRWSIFFFVSLSFLARFTSEEGWRLEIPLQISVGGECSCRNKR